VSAYVEINPGVVEEERLPLPPFSYVFGISIVCSLSSQNRTTAYIINVLSILYIYMQWQIMRILL